MSHFTYRFDPGVKFYPMLHTVLPQGQISVPVYIQACLRDKNLFYFKYRFASGIKLRGKDLPHFTYRFALGVKICPISVYVCLIGKDLSHFTYRFASWVKICPILHTGLPQGQKSILFYRQVCLSGKDLSHFTYRFASGVKISHFTYMFASAVKTCPILCTCLPQR